MKVMFKPLSTEELSASPGIHSVSEVAKGGKPETSQEEKEDNQHNPGVEPDKDDASQQEEKELKESKPMKPGCSITPEELQQAYANLFKSLSVIARS
jgi:hypothetical protein